MSADADRRTFLNVNRSVLGRRWVDRLTPAGDQTALAISQTTGLSDLTARLLAGRGIPEHDAQAYLDPSIKSLMPDPYVLTDMEAAAGRLAHAIKSGEKIAIFGDYDVDGATSSALLYRFCSHYGLTPTIYIPDRITEGYGPNSEAIQSLIEDGASLIVTVDCGATSFDALHKAKELGGDVVVLDHHQVGTTLPEARAIVNPNRHDDRSGLGHLAAVGVVFMTLVATQRILREISSSELLTNPINLLELLDLVALGTVCDVMPLKTLNRAFVRKGLVAMRNQQNPGIAALSVVSGVDGAIESGHLGFALGPRINAGGRVGDAALGARLLTVADPFEAEDIAGRLDRYNAERQAIEKAILEDAGAQALNELGPEGDADGEGGPAHFIASGEGWHPGVLGIVAARLKERYNRPCFALGFDRSGIGTGSGRSISGVDLGSAVREALDEGIIVKGGGHEMAAGLTVQSDRLGDLRAFLEERLSEDVTRERKNRALVIDGALTAQGAKLSLVDEIERAGPFGSGNPAPVFAFPSHRIAYASVVGSGHVRVTLKSGDQSSLSGIAFGAAESPLGKALLQSDSRPIHVAGTLSRNVWQGRESVQIRIKDAAFT